MKGSGAISLSRRKLLELPADLELGLPTPTYLTALNDQLELASASFSLYHRAGNQPSAARIESRRSTNQWAHLVS